MRIAPARCELVRVLGRGSSFAVALCAVAGAPAIAKRAIGDGGAIERERWALETLRGVHAPELLEAGGDEEGPFVVEALAAGMPLRAWLDRHRRDRATVARGAVSLAEAIRALHARGVVHADIAPANAWLDGSGAATLIDFGASGSVDGEPAPVGRGTLPWIPPELAREEVRPSERSDRYGVAALIAYVLTAEPLTEAATEASQLLAIGTNGLDLERLRRALDASRTGPFPSAVKESVIAALAPDAGRRPHSLDELLDALSSFRARLDAAPI